MNTDFLIPRNARDRSAIEEARNNPIPDSAMYGKLKEQALELAKTTEYPLGWIYMCLIAEHVPALREYMGR